MNRFLLCLLSICAVVTTSAQTLKGVVTSQSDGQPLVGVNVLEAGTTNGVTTNVDGSYAITLQGKETTTIVFEYIGYDAQEVAVNKSQTTLNVALKEGAIEMDDVVVIGYGAVKKSDLTGSVASVLTEDLKSGAITNADQMLQGTVAGVQVTQNSGAPGGASSIRVRGASSITSSNEPLYVIDGIPFSGSGSSVSWAGGGTEGQTTVNPLSTISPQDIVSMDVLKDASATAIYGSAGANGVIIINTRRGAEGAMKINYDGQYAIQTASNKLDMMNLSEYAQFQKDNSELYATLALDETFKDPSIMGEGTSWQDEIFRTAPMHSHALSISGGTEKLKMSASVGYTDQEGTIYGSNFDRYNMRLNADGKMLKNLEGGGSIAFTRTNERISRQDGNDGIIMQALTMQPSVAVYGFDGEFASPESIYGSSSNNPLWLAQMQQNTLVRDRIMGNFYLQLNLFDALNIRSEYGYDISNGLNKSFIPTYDFGNGIANSLNQMSQKEDHNLFWIWKNYATFNKSFKKHSINAMAGFEMQKSSWQGLQLRKSGFSTDDIFVMTADGTFDSNNAWQDAASKVSAFGRINYNYGERYLVTATMRADASSKFGPKNKWGYFPSAAFAWRISNEKFLKGVDEISNLKLRLGYGMVGNDNINTYQYGSTMTSIISPFGGASAYRVSNISNPNLKWEASEQFNAGIDVGFFNNRLAATVDVYQKNTKDLLMQISVPSYLGAGGGNSISAPFVNIGQTSNKGVDIAINTVPVQTRNFTWTSDVVFSKNKNEVVALNDDAQIISGGISIYFSSAFGSASRIQVGQPMGVFYGYQTDGYFRDEADVLDSAVQIEDGATGMNLYDKYSGVYAGDIKFKDLKKDGVIDDNDKTIIGDPNPDFTYGWNNKFSYKNWDLSVAINGSYGGDILNIARYRTESLSNAWDNQAAKVIDRAKILFDENDAAYVANVSTATAPRFAPNDINGNNRMSDRWLEDGSYLRIQAITLNYNFPKSMIQSLSMSSLKLYCTIQNLYTFTNYSGYDPEVGAFNQSALMQSYDMGRYPTPRMYIFGVNIGF